MITLTYTPLNRLHVYGVDIKNDYLQAPTSEKYCIIRGAEFDLEHVGNITIIVRALYGGKSAGTDY